MDEDEDGGGGRSVERGVSGIRRIHLPGAERWLRLEDEGFSMVMLVIFCWMFGDLGIGDC